MKNLHCLGMQKSTKGRVKSPMETAKESSLRKPSELLGAAKCSPVPGKHLPATIPGAIGETTHPPTRRKGTPRPKPSRKQYCKRSERASERQRAHRGQRRGAAPLATRGAARVGGVFLRRRWRRAANAVWGGEARGGVGRKGGEVGGNNGAERKDARRRGGFEF